MFIKYEINSIAVMEEKTIDCFFQGVINLSMVNYINFATDNNSLSMGLMSSATTFYFKTTKDAKVVYDAFIRAYSSQSDTDSDLIKITIIN